MKASHRNLLLPISVLLLAAIATTRRTNLEPTQTQTQTSTSTSTSTARMRSMLPTPPTGPLGARGMRQKRSLDEGSKTRTRFDVQLYLDLQFVDESLASELESLDASNPSVAQLCGAIQAQIFGDIVRNAAEAYNSTIVDDSLGCVIVGTARVYDPEAEDLFGYGYFSLQVHISQRVVLESTGQTTLYLEAVQSIVETGFDVVSGGQREFRTSLYAVNERFRSVLSVKIRRGLESPVPPPSLPPTVAAESEVPSEPPSFQPSQRPTAASSSDPSGAPSRIPSSGPSQFLSGTPSESPTGLASTSPTGFFSTVPPTNHPTLDGYDSRTQEHPATLRRSLLIAGILGASIVLFVMSLILCFLCYRWRRKERNRYRFSTTLPLSQSPNNYVPGVVELGEDRQSLADTTLGDPTQGARSRPIPANVLGSFDENSLFTSPFPIDEPEERASAILPDTLLSSLSGDLMMPLDYEDKVVFQTSVSDDSQSEGIEIPLGSTKPSASSPTETTRTEDSSVPVDDEASDSDVCITRIEPLESSRLEAPDDFSRVPSDLDVWSVEFDDFDKDWEHFEGEERSRAPSLSSSASTHQIKNTLPSTQLLGESNSESSPPKETGSTLPNVAVGDHGRSVLPGTVVGKDVFVDMTGKNRAEEYVSSLILRSRTAAEPSRGVTAAKKKLLPGSPSSSRESESTTLSFASQKTKTGAPTLESLGNGVVSTLTDLFDRMAIPKVTPEGKEVLYPDKTRSISAKSLRVEPNEPEIVKSTSDDDSGISASPWLMEKIENTLGPKSVNADLASMSSKSHKSHHSKSRTSQGRRYGSEVSYGSSSYYSRFSSQDVRSIMSAVSSSMSTDILAQKQPEEISFVKTSRDTLEDGIKRLELQLAALDQKENDDTTSSVTMSSITAGSLSNLSARSRTGRNRKKVLVIVPPGKLGVILADQHDGNGTVINSIKNGSPVTGVLKPGDRLVAVDEIAVIEMSCSQITSLIASRADRERRFTVMTTVVNQTKTTSNT